MPKLPITLACDGYDRTEALRSGEVTVAGVDLNYLKQPVEETFYRMVKYREFDAAELSLSSYTLTLDDADPPFVAIPVFPSRMFRHSGIYVNAAGGVQKPEELAGAIVGIPEYQVTAAVWIRGILAEYHGVPVNSVRYRTGGLHQPGRHEKIALNIPADVEILPIDDHQTLAQMLLDGEIDALYTPRTPQPFADGNPAIRRLFVDSKSAEQDYFRATGIFPIMHVLALRRDVYDANRWVARSLFDAFTEAKRIALARIEETVSLQYALPWLPTAVAETRSLLGDDWWSYGVNPADPTLSTFLRYSHEQGLASKLWMPEQLFAPETLDSVAI